LSLGEALADFPEIAQDRQVTLNDRRRHLCDLLFAGVPSDRKYDVESPMLDSQDAATVSNVPIAAVSSRAMLHLMSASWHEPAG
jgi:hypothetical protein